MRLFAAPTTGHYYFHIWYLPERVNFRVLIGDREQLPPPVPEELAENAVGHMTIRLNNYHGWIDIKGTGRILGFMFAFDEYLDPMFAQSFHREDATDIEDERRLVVAGAGDLADLKLGDLGGR